MVGVHGMLNMKYINKEEDVTDSMINKWDKIIKYEQENKPKVEKDFDLVVNGLYTKGVVDTEFRCVVGLLIKTSRNLKYLESKLITLEGIRELKEEDNFFYILKRNLGLEEDKGVMVKVNNIELKSKL